jgi:hypothetical protein
LVEASDEPPQPAIASAPRAPAINVTIAERRRRVTLEVM